MCTILRQDAPLNKMLCAQFLHIWIIAFILFQIDFAVVAIQNNNFFASYARI